MLGREGTIRFIIITSKIRKHLCMIPSTLPVGNKDQTLEQTEAVGIICSKLDQITI
jgi:hypothetical protein